MKKIVIFLALFISAECFAQNPNQNNNQVKSAVNTRALQAPNPGYKSTELTPEQKIQIEKNTAEQKEFENILKNLTPDQNKKFQKINQDFGNKMVEYSKKLDDEIVRISKLKSLVAINTYILKGAQTQRPGGSASKEMQEFFQKQINAYEKLSPEQKILVKKELIKYRKNINALEKKRRQDFKILLKKDLTFFKERETEKEIEDDNKF
jgi:hypothetical protein